MPGVRPSVRACALAAALAGAPAVLAQPSPTTDVQTVWNCWYNDDTTYRCRLIRTPDDPTVRELDPRQQSRASLRPRRGALPPITATILDHPAHLRGRTITIPVLTEPRDPQFAAMLVDAVMCGGRPNCSARILRSRAAVAFEYEEDPGREP